MTTPPAATPVNLIRGLFDADRDGVAQFAPGGRAEAEAWLRVALVDFEALQLHIALLSELYASPIFLPRPRRDRWDTGGYTTDELPGVFPHSGPLPDERVTAVCDVGLSALSDLEMAGLMLNPYALFDLYDVIDEVMPEAWLSALHTVARTVEVKSADRVPRSRRRSILPALAALIAGVVVGGFGLLGIQRVNEGARSTASASFRAADARGGVGGQLQAVVSSGFDGFAVIVILTPNHSPIVYPGLGAEPWRVSPGTPAVSAPLPVNPGARAVIIVTETPADEQIRSAADGWFKSVAVSDASSLESVLRKELATYNYRRIATSVVEYAPSTP